MKKESKLMKYFLVPFIGVLAFSYVSAESALISSYWNSNTTEKLVPNCTIRREYNDFTGQWTNNEVCFPKVVTVSTRPAPTCNTCNSTYGSNYSGGFSSSQYLLSSFGGSRTSNNYVSRPTTSYYSNTSYSRPYVGYYANNPYNTSSGSGYYTDAVRYYTPSVYSAYDYGLSYLSDLDYDDEDYYSYPSDYGYGGYRGYSSPEEYYYASTDPYVFGEINYDRNIEPIWSGYVGDEDY